MKHNGIDLPRAGLAGHIKAPSDSALFVAKCNSFLRSRGIPTNTYGGYGRGRHSIAQRKAAK